MQAAVAWAIRMRLEHEDVFAEGESRNIVIGRVEDVLLAAVYSTPEDNLYHGQQTLCMAPL
jgi:uncharacterized DUF497 family protein